MRHQDQHGLWVLGSAALGLGLLEAVLWFIRRWLGARATMGVEADIRKELYARLQILPMSFHRQWQSGQLLSRVMNDLGTIRQFLGFGLLFLVLIFWPGPAQVAEWLGRSCATGRNRVTYQCDWLDAADLLWTAFWVSLVLGAVLRITTRPAGQGPRTVDLRRLFRS